MIFFYKMTKNPCLIFFLRGWDNKNKCFWACVLGGGGAVDGRV